MRRIALVTDMLVGLGGAEKVFAIMCEAFPEADVYTSVCVPKDTFPYFSTREVRQLVTVPFINSDARLKALYPLAAWSMLRNPLRGYDVVISSAAHLARYVNVVGGKHFSYSYYPFRLLHEPQRYPQTGLKALAQRIAVPPLRAWDVRQAQKVDRFIAISEASRDAIKRYYHRDADIIHAPILNLPSAPPPTRMESDFVVVSRLEKWKRIDVVVEAFASLPHRRLVVVGDGSLRRELEAMATSNVTFAGSVTEEQLVAYYRNARALIHPTATEFGLTPIEANAHGTPAICYGRDGVFETMVSYDIDPARASAVFFDEQTPASVAEAVERFCGLSFSSANCFANAQRFSPETFQAALRAYVERHG